MRMMIEPSLPRRSETSQQHPLFTVTMEGMAYAEEKETKDPMDEEILTETVEEKKTTIQNTAAPAEQ
jgi:hypothetical protein